MMHYRRVALVLFAVGCSTEPYETAPVAGQVTVDGQPAPKVAVMFQPVASAGHLNPGPGAYGITDAKGHYSLKLIGKETRGAVVGRHKVRIENYTDPGDPSEDLGDGESGGREAGRDPAMVVKEQDEESEQAENSG